MPKNVGKSKPFTGSEKKDYPYRWSFFKTLRILRLRPQNPKNPKDPKKRMTPLNLLFQDTSYSLALKYSSFLFKFFSFAFYNIYF